MIHLRAWRQEFDGGTTGRSWVVRVPVLLFCTWHLVCWFADPDRRNIFSGLNLGIHEAGHLLTGAFAAFACAIVGVAWGAWVLWRMARLTAGDSFPDNDEGALMRMASLTSTSEG